MLMDESFATFDVSICNHSRGNIIHHANEETPRRFNCLYLEPIAGDGVSKAGLAEWTWQIYPSTTSMVRADYPGGDSINHGAICSCCRRFVSGGENKQMVEDTRSIM